jgi:hypothetical protein
MRNLLDLIHIQSTREGVPLVCQNFVIEVSTGERAQELSKEVDDLRRQLREQQLQQQTQINGTQHQLHQDR